MTAPTKPLPVPVPDDEPAGERLSWTAAMLDGTVFTPVGRGRNQGYARDEVDAFKDRSVLLAEELERALAYEREQREAAREALRLLADQGAAKRNAAKQGPPVMAVSAMVGAQAQAEGELARAREEFRRVRARTRAMWEQAQAALEHAQDDGGVPAEPDLPEPPQPTGDPVADLNARREHLQEVATALDAWEAQMNEHVAGRMVKLAEGRGALAEQRDGFVHLLDELANAVPAVRAQVVAIDTVEAAAGGEPSDVAAEAS